MKSPCNGNAPMLNSKTKLPYTCKHTKDCPSDSYCDREFSRCCSKSRLINISHLGKYLKVKLLLLVLLGNHIQTGLKCEKDRDCRDSNMHCIQNSCILISSCMNSSFGCCPDGFTPAQGKDNLGCPKPCNCHPAGKKANKKLNYQKEKC